MNLPLKSAIYAGAVRHRRFTPIERSFRYRLFMMYLDLDELDIVFGRHRLWGYSNLHPARFSRADYLGDPETPLRESVLVEYERQAGWRPDGPVRVLTHLRYWGVCFNPITIYYCFENDRDSEPAGAVVEVTNTPWGDRHNYLIEAADRSDGGVLEAQMDKAMHVSPMMAMDHRYIVRLNAPGQSLSVRIESSRDSSTVFDADLSLRRVEITRNTLTRALFRFPPIPLVVLGGIYSQAARIRLRGVPWFSRPQDETV